MFGVTADVVKFHCNNTKQSHVAVFFFLFCYCTLCTSVPVLRAGATTGVIWLFGIKLDSVPNADIEVRDGSWTANNGCSMDTCSEQRQRRRMKRGGWGEEK